MNKPLLISIFSFLLATSTYGKTLTPCQIRSEINIDTINDNEVINIGSRLELFIDDYLIDNLSNLSLRLHHPVDKGSVLRFNESWEGPFSGYCTIIKDNSLFKLYYRGLPSAGKDGSTNENTCYAESKDGIHWTKPNIKIYEIGGSFNNNVILSDIAPVTHNFSPFLDTRIDVAPKYKYKALGGIGSSGLIPYVSENGILWKNLQKDPVITGKKSDFDSQNVSFWSEEEQRYICYYRTWTKINDTGFRSISRITSKDFVHWAEPVQMDFGNTEVEQLYTNQTSPYFRAPHIYLSIAARFMPDRQVLSEEEALRLDVNPKYFKDCSDAILMTSRGGNKYDRTFMESFIRPGIGLQNWVSRSNYPALNVVQTSSNELSIYVNQEYAQASAHLRRYTLRIDGFVSVHATYNTGELTTKPIRFEGKELIINYSTSAAGYIKVEIIDIKGDKIKGFELDNSTEIIGNEIEKVVSWKGNPDLKEIGNQPVRLRFMMKDADLFSFQFK